MHTGDLAVMDDDGYLNIVGRIKDMVIRGGENIYPREIEEFLYTHPDVDGRPGDRRARRAVRRGADGRGAAAVRAPTVDRGRRSASSAAAASPTTRCRATCMFVDEYPMTVTGKVQKYKLREQAIADLGLERRRRHRDRLNLVPRKVCVGARHRCTTCTPIVGEAAGPRSLSSSQTHQRTGVPDGWPRIDC